jgi:hypothetical protein
MSDGSGGALNDTEGGDPGFEERADHISEQVLRTDTVTGDWFDDIYKALLSRGTVFVIGPRGCGKTHMMRYCWLKCCEHKNSPLAIYVSFNRYLRLEPLLKTRADALSLFQTWVLCRILIAADETAERLSYDADGEGGKAKSDIFESFELTREKVDALVARLERAGSLSPEEEVSANAISMKQWYKRLPTFPNRSGVPA